MPALEQPAQTLRVTKGLFTLLVILVGLHATWLLAGAQPAHWRPVIGNLAFFPVFLTAALLTVHAARVHAGPVRRAWHLIGAALLAWTAGQAWYTYLDLTRDGALFPSLADIGFIALAPLSALGVMHFFTTRFTRAQAFTFALDVLIVTVTGYGVAVDVGIIGASAPSVAYAVAVTAYGITDLLLVATLLVMTLWQPRPGSEQRSLNYLAAGILALIVTHIVMGSLLDGGAYHVGLPVDLLYSGSAALFGLAAYRAVSERHARPFAPPLARAPADAYATLAGLHALRVLPFVAMGISIVRVATHHAGGHEAADGTVGAYVVLVLAVARLATTEWQNWLLSRRLLAQAYRDDLTGLPNRAALHATLPHLVERAQRDGTLVGVMFVDLDGFKPINDLLGHAAGDEVLREVCVRVRDAVRATDFVARIGGDELVIVLPALPSAGTASVTAERILASLARPYAAGGQVVSVSASIGISLVPQDTTDAGHAVGYADLAMYEAKQDGKGSYRYYDARLVTDSTEHFQLGAHLRHALERGEFELYYQPVVQLGGSATRSFEALLRWNHPTLGQIPPSKFIPVAETNGMIRQISAWVLHEATRQVREWRDAYSDDVIVSLNVSARHFATDDFALHIERALSAHGLPGSALVLELTESTLLVNLEAGNAKLARLRALGVTVALDDFGTGYSSLAYLERLEVDSLKIDRSFIQSAGLSGGPLVRAMASLARDLGLHVVAEGVEDERQLGVVRQYGIDAVQGYYFSKPVTAAEIGALLRDETLLGSDASTPPDTAPRPSGKR